MDILPEAQGDVKQARNLDTKTGLQILYIFLSLDVHTTILKWPYQRNCGEEKNEIIENKFLA